MTDAFMANAAVRERYGLTEGDRFGEKFSSVSLENILFFVVAACCHVMECLMDAYRDDIEKRISTVVVGSVPWYYKMALAYQKGDELVLDDQTQQYRYAHVDESKQVVKYAAVRDRGTSVQILVSGDDDGSPVLLSNDVLTPFKDYMNRVKVAGVILNISSKASDHVVINAKVTVDRLILDESGVKLSDGSKPVEAAIREHLKQIVYGGTFNKTKLVDAIQTVAGVADVELGECLYRADGEDNWTVIKGNNYTGNSGSYIPDGLDKSITYVVQD